MPIDVITTDNLKYHRLVASKDTESGERWERIFYWYPGRQNIEFSRIAQIYCESQHIHGNDIIMKYAWERRLNKKHAYNHADSLKVLGKQQEQANNINSMAKVPPTTNAEYGRFKPTRMHYC